MDSSEELRVLFEVALEDVLHVPENVAHVEDVLGARQVDEQVTLGAVLTLELLADELRCKLKNNFYINRCTLYRYGH